MRAHSTPMRLPTSAVPAGDNCQDDKDWQRQVAELPLPDSWELAVITDGAGATGPTHPTGNGGMWVVPVNVQRAQRA